MRKYFQEKIRFLFDSSHSHKSRNEMSESGFTLLEIILAIGILATIVMLAMNLLSDEMAVRQKITNVYPFEKIMERIAKDISGSYLLPSKTGNQFNMGEKETKFVYVTTDSDLVFSVVNHASLIRNSSESNFANMRYYTKKNFSTDKLELLRVVDANIKPNESITTSGVGTSMVLVEDIKSFSLKFWNGKKFADDWDSSKNETLGKLPVMVKINLILYMPLNPTGTQKKELLLEKIVLVRNALGRSEAEKEPSGGEYKWQ